MILSGWGQWIQSSRNNFCISPNSLIWMGNSEIQGTERWGQKKKAEWGNIYYVPFRCFACVVLSASCFHRQSLPCNCCSIHPYTLVSIYDTLLLVSVPIPTLLLWSCSSVHLNAFTIVFLSLAMPNFRHGGSWVPTRDQTCIPCCEVWSQPLDHHPPACT